MQGYFDDVKKEYVITDMKPRRPLTNYLWNEQCVCKCDQFGNGFSWRAVGRQRRNVESGERNVYIKDRETGEVYSANRNYNDLPFDVFEAHVGLGYHTVISSYKGLDVSFTTLVPTQDAVTLFQIKAKNTTQKDKKISLYFTVKPTPDLSGHDAYGEGDYCEQINGLLYTHDGFRLPNDYTKISVASLRKFDGYECSTPRFKGEYNGWHNPIALQAEKLLSKGMTFESDYIAAFEFDLCLQAGEEFENVFMIAATQNMDQAVALKDKYVGCGCFEREMGAQKELNAGYLDVFTMESPDAYLNTQANTWLKRQLSLGKTWGRLYGKGFRDVMQDITAFVSFDCNLAKERILYALQYQYEDGNPIRMFEPNYYYPYNDGGVWITGALLSYLNESGDLSILKEEVGYLAGKSAEKSSGNAEIINFAPYEASEQKDSVLCHLCRAIDYLLSDRGERNLILWRGGDWNDSMNSVGLQNKGESVWLAIATVKAINELQEILSIVGGYEDKITAYQLKKEELVAAIQKHGRVEGHYIYGINDKGDKIGAEERTFLNPQSWAVLANLTDKAELEKCMDTVEKELRCDFGYVQCYPSFDKGSLDIGRVSYFKKGLVENGAVYNHGVAFKIAADCMLGRGDTAYKSFKMISYDNPKNSNNGVEPYAVSNMYMGPENPHIAGYAPMSWVTGTAGWLYRCVSEYICGVKPTFKGLRIEPCLPSGWSGTKVTRKYRGETYTITFVQTGNRKLVCDGVETEVLPLAGSGAKHEVVCEY